MKDFTEEILKNFADRASPTIPDSTPNPASNSNTHRFAGDEYDWEGVDFKLSGGKHNFNEGVRDLSEEEKRLDEAKQQILAIKQKIDSVGSEKILDKSFIDGLRASIGSIESDVDSVGSVVSIKKEIEGKIIEPVSINLNKIMDAGVAQAKHSKKVSQSGAVFGIIGVLGFIFSVLTYFFSSPFFTGITPASQDQVLAISKAIMGTSEDGTQSLIQGIGNISEGLGDNKKIIEENRKVLQDVIAGINKQNELSQTLFRMPPVQSEFYQADDFALSRDAVCFSVNIDSIEQRRDGSLFVVGDCLRGISVTLNGVQVPYTKSGRNMLNIESLPPLVESGMAAITVQPIKQPSDDLADLNDGLIGSVPSLGEIEFSGDTQSFEFSLPPGGFKKWSVIGSSQSLGEGVKFDNFTPDTTSRSGRFDIAPEVLNAEEMFLWVRHRGVHTRDLAHCEYQSPEGAAEGTTEPVTGPVQVLQDTRLVLRGREFPLSQYENAWREFCVPALESQTLIRLDNRSFLSSDNDYQIYAGRLRLPDGTLTLDNFDVISVDILYR